MICQPVCLYTGACFNIQSCVIYSTGQWRIVRNMKTVKCSLATTRLKNANETNAIGIEGSVQLCRRETLSVCLLVPPHPRDDSAGLTAKLIKLTSTHFGWFYHFTFIIFRIVILLNRTLYSID